LIVEYFRTRKTTVNYGGFFYALKNGLLTFVV